MAITNHERVGKALEFLKAGLGPFVDREIKAPIAANTLSMKKVRGFVDDPNLANKGIVEWDAAALLKLMWETWNEPCPSKELALARLRFRGKQEFPCNEGTRTVVQVGGRDRYIEDALNVAVFEEGTLGFEIAHEAEHTVLTLSLARSDYHEASASRVHETLQFVLGKQLAWMALETTMGGEQVTKLMSPSRSSASMLPPLTIRPIDPGGDLWRMFCDYFRYVHSDKGDLWHPLSRHVGSAINAHGASLEASLLALAVAVEGVAGDCFSDAERLWSRIPCRSAFACHAPRFGVAGFKVG